MHRPDLSYRQSLILLVALVLGAYFLRIGDLAHTPPGIASDETYEFADALRISRGIPFPAVFDTRPEPLHRFFLAVWASLTGFYPFTLLLSSGLIGVLTVALTYCAGLTLLAGQAWRRLGALVAAGALAAMMPHVFLSRVTYRTILLPVVVLAALIWLLRASRSGSARQWIAGGLVAGFGVHTYLAGIMTPVWAAGFIVHQLILAKKRISLRQAGYTVLGMIPPLAAWGLLIWLVPDLFSRVGEVSAATSVPLVRRLLDGLRQTPNAFFLRGFYLPLYDTPNTPFLNPALALLAVVGILVALWRWRHAEGILLLGGLLAFSIPAALSQDATHPPRLVGTMPLLALLAGWGAAWVVKQFTVRIRHVGVFREMPLRTRPALVSVGVIVLLSLSLAGTHLAYQAMFTDPARYADPYDWLSIPHNYTMALTEALQLLEKVDQPTYVPLWALNNPAAMFYLQRQAFPKVMTWARYGSTRLPAGQLFYPEHGYYHDDAPKADYIQGLLLPADKTIVLVPVPVSQPPGSAAKIVDEHGWTIARSADVAESDLPSVTKVASAPDVGTGLRPVFWQTFTPELKKGGQAAVMIGWEVGAPQPADVFTFTQLIGMDFNAYASSDHHVLPYVYPSALWQPGDIIPDVHILSLPDNLPDGVFRWGTGAYIPPGQARLPVIAPNDRTTVLQNMWLWGAAPIPAPPTAQPLPPTATKLQAHLDDGITLEGYQLTQDKTTWTLTLYWRSSRLPEGDYTLFVHATHGDQMIAQQDTKPQGGALPTWAWLPGELVTTTHTLDLPADSPLPDTLYVGMYSYPSLQRLAVQNSSVSVTDNRIEVWQQPGQ